LKINNNLKELDGSEEVIYFNGAIGTQVGVKF